MTKVVVGPPAITEETMILWDAVAVGGCYHGDGDEPVKEPLPAR